MHVNNLPKVVTWRRASRQETISSWHQWTEYNISSFPITINRFKKNCQPH